MKIFKNNFLMKLMATLCLVVMLFVFVAPARVRADGDEVTVGGVLLEPIVKLFTALADGTMELLHTGAQGQGVGIIKIDGSQDWWEVLGTIFAVAILVTALLIFASGGIAAGLAAAAASWGIGISSTISLATVAGCSIVGVWAGIKAADWFFPDDIYLPAFTVGVQEIFSNKLPMFDVNFFEPLEDKDYESKQIPLPNENISSLSSKDNSTYTYYSELDAYNKAEIGDGEFPEDQYDIITRIIADLNVGLSAKGMDQIDVTKNKYYISSTRER